MNKTLATLVFLALLPILSVNAQEKDSLRLKLNGFLRFDYWNDTRVTDDAIEGIVSLVPSAKSMDGYGNDLNEKSSANALAVSSRVKLSISGTHVLGAAAAGLLEADFTGAAGTSRVRLRHAAITLNWPKSSLLMGSYWHQMVVPDAFPSVIGLSTGAPIQCFNRSPQVTYSYKFTNSFQATGSAAWESDYTSNGPDGASSKYLRNSSIPDFTLHLRYSVSKFMFGVLGEAFWIQPRLYTTPIGLDNKPLPAPKKQTNTLLGSYSCQGYVKYSGSKLFVVGKAMVGQNPSHHLLIGGYGTTSVDATTGKESYTPFNHLYTFLNIGYGTKIKPSIFIGYAKNLGTSKEIVGYENVYGRSLNIASLVRVAPNVSWTINNLMFAAELEYTNAEYGTMTPHSKGKLVDTYHVSNTRFLLIAQYNF